MNVRRSVSGGLIGAAVGGLHGFSLRDPHHRGLRRRRGNAGSGSPRKYGTRLTGNIEREERTVSQGERSAVCASIGAAIGTGVGVAFMSALGVVSIAVFAVFGAIVGMISGYVCKGNQNDGG